MYVPEPKSGTRRYGCWAGYPEGTRENKEHCIAEVYGWPSHISYQCQRKRGHGPNGEFCKQHAKKAEA